MVTAMLIGFGLSYPNKGVILLAIVITAIADGFANSTAFHVSEETERFHSKKEVYKSTLYCFVSTIISFIIPIIPIIFLPLNLGIIIGVIIAFIMMILLGYFVAKIARRNWKKLSLEYLIMGIVAAIACYFVGQLIILAELL